MTTTLARPARFVAAGALLASSGSTVAVAQPAVAETGADLNAFREAIARHPAQVGSAPGVELPDHAAAGATMELADGTRMEIDLPFTSATSAGSTVHVDSYTDVFHEPTSDVSMAVQPLLTGGLRVLGQAGSEASPDEYRFGFGDAVASLALAGDGSVSARDAVGDVVATVAPPWAQDAHGAPVPTRFEVDGTTLVQHVEHRGAAHPVTFDPAIQGDCGIITCTIRLNRERTRDLRDVSDVAIGATVVCAPLPGPLRVGCAVVVGGNAVLISKAASRYYEDGDCLKLKVRPDVPFPQVVPQRLEHGSYNCTDK